MEALRRYCFDDEEYGQLLSPCECKGGQKWVHLSCLRRWQRMVLVSQPTHPRFYRDDVRHHECNVCKSQFTCEPPTRHELMQSFTGVEIAALLNEGCVIASHQVFSDELARQLEDMPAALQSVDPGGYKHWIRGSYLITAVKTDDGLLPLDDIDQQTLDVVRTRMGMEMEMEIQGQDFELTPAGSLEGVAPGADLLAAFHALSAPASLVLAAVRTEPATCGDDSICAVNLTRCFAPTDSCRPSALAQTMAELNAHPMPEVAAAAAAVEISHFLGGPCDDDEIVTCLVVGGSARGWKFVEGLEEAVVLAHKRSRLWRGASASANTGVAATATTAESTAGSEGGDMETTDDEASAPGGGGVGGGQTVRLVGLQARPELNGAVGCAIKFV